MWISTTASKPKRRSTGCCSPLKRNSTGATTASPANTTKTEIPAMTQTTSPVKIGILGVGGRMGQMIVQEILSGAQDGAVLSAAVDHESSWAIGQDIGAAMGLGPCGVSVTA